MESGYNTNVRHRKQVFHVQTEDKGLDNPIVETLIYLAGTVIYAKRTPYDPKKTEEQIASKLVEMQHKQIIQQIVRGKLDETIMPPTNGNSQAEVLRNKSSLDTDKFASHSFDKVTDQRSSVHAESKKNEESKQNYAVPLIITDESETITQSTAANEDEHRSSEKKSKATPRTKTPRYISGTSLRKSSSFFKNADISDKIKKYAGTTNGVEEKKEAVRKILKEMSQWMREVIYITIVERKQNSILADAHPSGIKLPENDTENLIKLALSVMNSFDFDSIEAGPIEEITLDAKNLLWFVKAMSPEYLLIILTTSKGRRDLIRTVIKHYEVVLKLKL